MEDGTHFDAIVVGSGFGGSVMACRLAEASLQVCLLERGRAYPPDSFARSPDGVRNNVWDPASGRHGLFDIWSFRDIDSIVASGLGGGSLIYANVLLRKDESWFIRNEPGGASQEYWPITRADLDPHYDRVERMLTPVPYPFDQAPYDRTPRTTEFHQAVRKLGMEPFLPPLAVTFAPEPGAAAVTGEPIREQYPNLHGRTRQTCRLCGECDIGCNYGSKNTLDFNYLSAAKRFGADLRTGCEVIRFEPRPAGGYSVTYQEHPAGFDDQASPEPALRTITADRLILSAGTLGTTRLLLRNRVAFPDLSRRLGTRFSGNGDLLTFAIGATEQANGKTIPRLIDAGRGPVITSAVRVADTADGEGDDGPGFYLQDAGYPQHLAWAFQLLDTPAAVWSLVGSLLRRRRRAERGKGAAPEVAAIMSNLLLGDTRLSSGTLPMLAMGRDTPDGQFLLRDGTLDLIWHKRTSGPYFRRVRDLSEQLAHALGARYLDDPLWHVGRVVTVHPLGGCPMGRNIDEGVVDAHGQAFGYPGLYIADGSIMPGPVGANPSLTIAAIADRCADSLLADAGRPVA